jgi:spermidine/putrescine transport system ATP-binding protein
VNTSNDSATYSPAVALRAVTKRFGGTSRVAGQASDVLAVDRVTLEVGDGEFFALLGPSGCGKTTTLRMIAGLDDPTTGSIEVFGHDVANLPANRRPVNTVFQDYALFPHLDVSANVGFGLKMQKVPRPEIRSRVGEALEMVRMNGLGSRRPSQLSGGQRQRVALARALINRPRVLLLDEPLGALDLQLRREMQHELKTLQRDLGIAFVFVTHDQEEALSMSDRVAIMDGGRLLQVDTPAGVYERPADRFVAGFVGQTNLLDATVVDGHSICLTNGMRLPIDNDLPTGTPVGAILRPERARLQHRDGSAPSSDGAPFVDGVIEDVTYVGSAIIHRVALDWMRLDVRLENGAGERFEPGDAVRATWPADAIALVET